MMTMTTIGPKTDRKQPNRKPCCRTCGRHEDEHTSFDEANPPHIFEPRLRGFAAMSREKVQEIASKGGKEAHRQGTAHRFTEEEARAAGVKGGNAPHRKRGRTIINPA